MSVAVPVKKKERHRPTLTTHDPSAVGVGVKAEVYTVRIHAAEGEGTRRYYHNPGDHLLGDQPARVELLELDRAGDAPANNGWGRVVWSFPYRSKTSSGAGKHVGSGEKETSVASTGTAEELAVPFKSISVIRLLAKQLATSKVGVRKISHEDACKKYGLSFIRLSFADQFVSRSDMYYVARSLLFRDIGAGEEVQYDTIKLKVAAAMMNNHQAAGAPARTPTSQHRLPLSPPSRDATQRTGPEHGPECNHGFVTADTKVCFESQTYVSVWMLHLSEELWSQTSDGRVRLDWMIDGFISQLVEQYQHYKVRPMVRVIFFGRVNTEGLNEEDAKGISDIVTSATFIRSDAALHELPLQIRRQTAILVSSIRAKWRLGDMYPPQHKLFVPAAKSNFLEAVCVALDGFSRHHVDRRLNISGHSLLVIGAGKGYYQVANRLSQVVAMRMLDHGIKKINLICVGRPPLHVSPVLEYSGSDPALVGQPGVELDPHRLYYESPEWIGVLFYHPSQARVEVGSPPRFRLFSRGQWDAEMGGQHAFGLILPEATGPLNPLQCTDSVVGGLTAVGVTGGPSPNSGFGLQVLGSGEMDEQVDGPASGDQQRGTPVNFQWFSRSIQPRGLGGGLFSEPLLPSATQEVTTGGPTMQGGEEAWFDSVPPDPVPLLTVEWYLRDDPLANPGPTSNTAQPNSSQHKRGTMLEGSGTAHTAQRHAVSRVGLKTVVLDSDLKGGSLSVELTIHPMFQEHVKWRSEALATEEGWGRFVRSLRHFGSGGGPGPLNADQVLGVEDPVLQQVLLRSNATLDVQQGRLSIQCAPLRSMESSSTEGDGTSLTLDSTPVFFSFHDVALLFSTNDPLMSQIFQDSAPVDGGPVSSNEFDFDGRPGTGGLQPVRFVQMMPQHSYAFALQPIDPRDTTGNSHSSLAHRFDMLTTEHAMTARWFNAYPSQMPGVQAGSGGASGSDSLDSHWGDICLCPLLPLTCPDFFSGKVPADAYDVDPPYQVTVFPPFKDTESLFNELVAQRLHTQYQIVETSWLDGHRATLTISHQNQTIEVRDAQSLTVVRKCYKGVYKQPNEALTQGETRFFVRNYIVGSRSAHEPPQIQSTNFLGTLAPNMQAFELGIPRHLGIRPHLSRDLDLPWSTYDTQLIAQRDFELDNRFSQRQTAYCVVPVPVNSAVTQTSFSSLMSPSQASPSGPDMTSEFPSPVVPSPVTSASGQPSGLTTPISAVGPSQPLSTPSPVTTSVTALRRRHMRDLISAPFHKRWQVDQVAVTTPRGGTQTLRVGSNELFEDCTEPLSFSTPTGDTVPAAQDSASPNEVSHNCYRMVQSASGVYARDLVVLGSGEAAVSSSSTPLGTGGASAPSPTGVLKEKHVVDRHPFFFACLDKTYNGQCALSIQLVWWMCSGNHISDWVAQFHRLAHKRDFRVFNVPVEVVPRGPCRLLGNWFLFRDDDAIQEFLLRVIKDLGFFPIGSAKMEPGSRLIHHTGSSILLLATTNPKSPTFQGLPSWIQQELRVLAAGGIVGADSSTLGNTVSPGSVQGSGLASSGPNSRITSPGLAQETEHGEPPPRSTQKPHFPALVWMENYEVEESTLRQKRCFDQLEGLRVELAHLLRGADVAE